MKCKCTKEKCAKNRCKCRKAGLTCIDLCGCSDTDEDCKNKSVDVNDDGCNDEDDDDDVDDDKSEYKNTFQTLMANLTKISLRKNFLRTQLNKRL